MLLYWIWFAQRKGVPPAVKRELLQHFHDPEEIYYAGEAAFASLEDWTAACTRALQEKDLTEAEAIASACHRKGIEILTFSDPDYPERLRHIQNPPMVLYYRGRLPDWDRQPVIGIVGTRKATGYGLQTAFRMGRQIAQCGGVVVSGAASGIDTKAMEGALETALPVVGVLGCGVDVIYPRTNRKLYAKTAEAGCLLSEYPPETPPLPWHFLERNRIISGISNGVLVVEAPAKSGALNTARHAREQGRDVFAVPANVDVANFEGSNALLEEGAIAAASGWRVCREYAHLYPETVAEPGKHTSGSGEPAKEKVAQKPVILEKREKKVIDNPGFSTYSVLENRIPAPSGEEARILSLLSRAPQHPDDVIAASGLEAAAVQRILTKLAVKGLVLMHSGGRISLK